MSSQVTQVCIGRFHHFHLARQLESFGMLKSIYTGYPRFKLEDETGIPSHKIKTYSWLQAPYMARSRFSLNRWEWLNREWAWQANQTLDQHVAQHLKEPTTLVALSGSGLSSGIQAQALGGHFICDRGSSHIRFQDNLLREESERWGIPYKGIDPRFIEKEESEYKTSDYISVPSEFVRKSFIAQGVSQEKIVKTPYGVRLERFQQVTRPNLNEFRILYVGAVSLRKGFLDLLQAFRLFNHPTKHLTVIGSISSEIRPLINQYNSSSIEYLGNVPNTKLSNYYSRSHVFVLPSIEEGFGMVLAEAMACGCPVIASENTGAHDLVKSGKGGFIVPIRQPDKIVDVLDMLASDTELRLHQSILAKACVQNLGGWDQYGAIWKSFLQSLEIRNVNQEMTSYH